MDAMKSPPPTKAPGPEMLEKPKRKRYPARRWAGGATSSVGPSKKFGTRRNGSAGALHYRRYPAED